MYDALQASKKYWTSELDPVTLCCLGSEEMCTWLKETFIVIPGAVCVRAGGEANSSGSSDGPGADDQQGV